jgi:hypothetical protein
LEYNTSVVSGFLAIAFLIENSEECSLPFVIVTMTVPVILEECVYVLNAIRGQCFESLCWNTGLTGRLIVGEFSDMFLYFSNRRTRTQCIKSGALGNVIEDGEINRCVITIVHFVTVCMKDFKVCCRCGGNVASGGITKVEVSRGDGDEWWSPFPACGQCPTLLWDRCAWHVCWLEQQVG